MLKQITGNPRIGKREIKRLKKLRPFIGGEWDGKRPNLKEFKLEIAEFKRKMNAVLSALQKGYCAYCGLKLEETSGAELEHIAPKGGSARPKHLEWTFTPFNLCLACSLCNGFSKKSTTDTIVKKNVNYRLCKFSIVHPYFHNPEDHFDWIGVKGQIIIQAKSPEGAESIKMFDLASPIMTEARTKQVTHDYNKTQPDHDKRVQAALDYSLKR